MLRVGEIVFLRGRVHQLAIQYQMVRPPPKIYIYIHVTTIHEKSGQEFKRELGEIYGSVCRKERAGGIMQLYYNLKIKETTNKSIIEK